MGFWVSLHFFSGRWFELTRYVTSGHVHELLLSFAHLSVFLPIFRSLSRSLSHYRCLSLVLLLFPFFGFRPLELFVSLVIFHCESCFSSSFTHPLVPSLHSPIHSSLLCPLTLVIEPSLAVLHSSLSFFMCLFPSLGLGLPYSSTIVRPLHDSKSTTNKKRKET